MYNSNYKKEKLMKKYIYLGLLLFINLVSGADVREQEDEINRINKLANQGVASILNLINHSLCEGNPDGPALQNNFNEIFINNNMQNLFKLPRRQGRIYFPALFLALRNELSTTEIPLPWEPNRYLKGFYNES